MALLHKHSRPAEWHPSLYTTFTFLFDATIFDWFHKRMSHDTGCFGGRFISFLRLNLKSNQFNPLQKWISLNHQWMHRPNFVISLSKIMYKIIKQIKVQTWLTSLVVYCMFWVRNNIKINNLIYWGILKIIRK